MVYVLHVCSHALLLAKYEASEARLSDVKSIDEKLSNNFASLTKGLEDIRMAGIIGGPVVATQAGDKCRHITRKT